MRLIQDHVVPRLSLEDMRIAASKCVRRDADIEMEFIVPALAQLLPSLGSTVISKDLESREKLLKFHLPVHENTGRHDNQMRTPDALIACKMGQESDSLDGLSGDKSTYVWRQNGQTRTQAPSRLQGCN